MDSRPPNLRVPEPECSGGLNCARPSLDVRLIPLGERQVVRGVSLKSEQPVASVRNDHVRRHPIPIVAKAVPITEGCAFPLEYGGVWLAPYRDSLTASHGTWCTLTSARPSEQRQIGPP